MKSFIEYAEYGFCLVVALTHEKIALLLTNVAVINNEEATQKTLQTIVLLLTATGVLIKIIIDILIYIHKKNSINKKNKQDEH